MILPNNTQILTEENKLAIATKEQEGNIVATGGASDLTCLVDNGELAVKVVNVEGESASDSATSAEVLTDNNDLAISTLSQDGNVLATDGEKGLTCLVEGENGAKQIALKTFTLDGTILATDGAKNTTCLVQDANGKAQLALKVFGSSADWKGKPADWSDIRKDCPANSIALYAGHTPLQQWTLGDRLDNKATFVGYFDSVNPDDNTTQRYAYFVLDGNYRDVGKWSANSTASAALSGMTDNIFYWSSSQTPRPIDSKLSGTWVMNKIKALGVSDYPLFDHANNISVSYNGNTYTAVVPNTYQLKQIWNNREALDTYDPSGTNDLTTWQFGTRTRAFSCAITEGNSSYTEYTGYVIKSTGAEGSTGTLSGGNFTSGYIPIIEIPVDNSNIQYDNLGFTATCTGGYNVYIDGTQYGTTYASGAQCSITWSTSGITTGDDITTPTALKAHKIWVEPATSGNNITAFKCANVSGSNEEQGILWAHFYTSNAISLNYGFSNATGIRYYNKALIAATAKNNNLKISNITYAFAYCNNLEYLPILDGNNNNIAALSAFRENIKIKNISLKNMNIIEYSYICSQCYALERVNTSNVVFQSTATSISTAFYRVRKLKQKPNENYTSVIQRMDNYLTQAAELQDTIIDTRNATALKVINTNGDSTYFASGIKGLRVSNEAPFDYATAPQINVSYTGMDRQALVQLFNDLPYNVGYTVVGSPTITDGVASGFSSSSYLSLTSTISPFGFDTSFESGVKFTTDVIAQMSIVGNGANQTMTGFRISSNGKLQARLRVAGSSTLDDTNLTAECDYVLQPNTTYNAKFYISNYSFHLELYSEAGTLLASDLQSIDTSYSSYYGIVSSYKIGYAQQGAFAGSIDLNNTYIKVNGVTWFNGKAAMTKTLSCVGATGTADLTAEDKDIALAKGWSITLS